MPLSIPIYLFLLVPDKSKRPTVLLQILF